MITRSALCHPYQVRAGQGSAGMPRLTAGGGARKLRQVRRRPARTAALAAAMAETLMGTMVLSVGMLGARGRAASVSSLHEGFIFSCSSMCMGTIRAHVIAACGSNKDSGTLVVLCLFSRAARYVCRSY